MVGNAGAIIADDRGPTKLKRERRTHEVQRRRDGQFFGLAGSVGLSHVICVMI